LFVIDRLEGDWAVIEYGDKTFNIPTGILPPEAKEGDVIDIIVKVQDKKTEGRKDKIKSLVDELFE
jgi:hypothetical protein